MTIEAAIALAEKARDDPDPLAAFHFGMEAIKRAVREGDICAVADHEAFIAFSKRDDVRRLLFSQDN